MTRAALVIHSDEKALRFVCDALTMFQPGFRVSSARNLDVAGEWLDAFTPDLVVLEASIADPDTLRQWSSRRGLDAQRTAIYGAASAQVAKLGFATVSEPVRLPMLMATVRDIVSHDNGYESAEHAS